MNSCTVFQLNILRLGQDCSFQLNWGERQQIFANLKYPEELSLLYQDWKSAYKRSYGAPLRAEIQDDFSFTPNQVDWKNKSEEAKVALLQKFQQWLGGVELLPIRNQIQSAAVRQISEKKRWLEQNNCVDLLIACDSPDLAKLPWEMWEIAPKDSSMAIHISRTAINAGNEVIAAGNIPRRGKPRILVILADAEELNLIEDKKAVQVLKKVADVSLVNIESGDIKQKFINYLLDDRGWDGLIFAGHSDETDLTGGKIVLAPGVTISISEIEHQLTEAKNRGLRVAIFNSCCGLSIAESLLRLGLSQVVMMREHIHDSVAHVFLNRLCQILVNYQDIQTGVLETCKYFESEKLAYPSAYLIPSLFRHPSPQADLFRFEALGLKRFWRTWKPTRREAIVLSTVLLFSFLPVVQDLLTDYRTFFQAVYRDLTQQLPRGTPPVRLVAIDQKSINQEGFNAQRMSRTYLAKLVDKIAEFNVKTVGIDYLLHSQESGEAQLANSIESAIKKHNTWFVFGANEEKDLRVHPDIAKPQWMLQGDATFFLWDMKLPDSQTCSLFNVNLSGNLPSCPFPYVLALSHLLNQNQSLGNLPEPQKILASPTEAISPKSFQDKLSQFIKQNRGKDKAIATLKQAFAPFGWRSVIDFSIPPDSAYDWIPARDFLTLDPKNPATRERIEGQIIIIGSGGYIDAEDNYSIPPAIDYWLHPQRRQESGAKDSRKSFSGAEAHAYMVYQFLSQRQVTLIPDFWLIGLGAVLGKGMVLMLLQVRAKKRRKLALLLVNLPVVGGLVGLQLYISSSVLVPWFFPSVVFGNYFLSVFRRKYHV
ncbi:MAG TPA: hypothetical protein DEG17_26610 [Cyanobacteria bacterium UBA11149]|nr:hypothetical protein [Cyanobacteria bacterium UBA11366]HBK62458.1 hypothetical protein [Cyanobacteria bacterium UBA11166]HBR72602.1 hypothetical protein [Cyanobacteria bacterium UBA11159]HBS71173.1 hypothetical protein [Cyanobacteria bacterium UBA11153]HBW92341.1 hypothetical protein [Cyanobacteria bacterium UBA11149]HCA96373.1 hypothetical protein [Cyanobacteria bacterium UBA9226]